MKKAGDIKKILVPLQFDLHSESLLHYAGGLAKEMGAELLLVHSTYENELTYTHLSTTIRAMRAYGERALANCQRSSGANYVTYDCVVRPGLLHHSIKAIVQDFKVDMVLLQACRQPCPDAGSADETTAIMEQLECPVMLVPANAVYNRMKHLVLATDFTDRDIKVLSRISRFAAQVGTELTLVQVYTKEQRQQLCSIKTALLETQQLLKGYTVKFKLLEEEDILEGIIDFAEDQQADMLIFATQDNHLVKRLCSHAYQKTKAYHTLIPMLRFMQLKHKPCSGCCADCKSKTTQLEFSASQLAYSAL